MNSPISVSDLESAYDRLHPAIRKWIRDQGWEELREVQARAILAVLDSPNDVLIAATTAAGKTEAAFLPVLTTVAARTGPGFGVIYISPLKALINDQFRRLDELCDRMEIPVVRWHGDAPQAGKKKAFAKPEGVALITPESVEAMLSRRPGDARRLLGSADFIIVDELHAFLQGPRGLHVASLLRRIDAMSIKPARRIGLSATIGDLAQAAAWLRPGDAPRVEILEAKSDAPELRLQVRGYVEPPDIDDPDRAEAEASGGGAVRVALDLISDHLFGALMGSNNLVFGGSRRTVEAAADRLRRRCEAMAVPNEFFPHHGSLSKTLREELEDRLKAAGLPTTAVCTSTLELGIDIGSVKSVAQIGAPRSLSSLRQRLGRTGRRRGTPSVLRVYVREPHIGGNSGILDRLHLPTVRSVAAIRLLLAGFVEPSFPSPEVLSTLVHQILSVITERGGVRPDTLYRLLCGPGPFLEIGKAEFAALLGHLGNQAVGLIEQAPDGTLMLGAKGEEIVQSRSFFAVFESTEEWRLVTGGRQLGTLPISFPVHEESLVVFAGQRWFVQSVDDQTKTLQVVPHSGGVVPRFERGSIEPVHDRLAAEMRAVYMDDDIPPWVDSAAAAFLAEARETFRYMQLDRTSLLEEGRDLHVFLWKGSQATAVFGTAFAMAGLAAEPHDFGITLPKTTKREALAILGKLAGMEILSPDDVASFVENIRAGKYAEFVPEALLRSQWSRHNAGVVERIPGLASEASIEVHGTAA
jgi:ATP-dependent Lhr-like helicase